MREVVPGRLGSWIVGLLNRERALPPLLALPALLSIPLAKNLPCLIAGHSSVAEGLSGTAMAVVTVPVFLVVALTQPRGKRMEVIRGAGLGLRILLVPLTATALFSGNLVVGLCCAGVFGELWWLDHVLTRSGLVPDAP